MFWHTFCTRTLRLRSLLLLALALAWVAGPASAELGSAMRAERLLPGERIRLDGGLDHPAWQRAPVYDSFTEKAPTLGATPPQVAFYLHHARQRGAEDVQKMTKARAKNAETRLLSAQSAGWGLRLGFLGATLQAHEADFADWLLQQAERADKTLCDVLVRLAKEKYHDAR
jgi:hypothetical protein